MVTLMVFLFSLFLASSCHELTPFILWSNTKVAQNIPVTEDVAAVVTSLQNKMGLVDKVVIFTSDELSFDEFNKYAGVYDDSSKSRHFTHLQSAMESSLSHYWTGIEYISMENWISKLANGGAVQYMNIDNIRLSQSHQKVVVIKLNDITSQDNVIANVLKDASGMSFLAIYTHSSLVPKLPTRVRREFEDDSITINERETIPGVPVLLAQDNNNNQNNVSCRMGGRFNSTDLDSVTNQTNPCLLFCLDSINYNFTFENEPQFNCTLNTPYSISGCCDEREVNYTLSDTYCFGESSPYVQFNFSAGMSNSSENLCVATNGSVNFDAADIVIKFIFPQDPNNTKAQQWYVMMESMITVTTDMNTNLTQFFDNITRASPSANLYEPFEINQGLSYACSANEYNRYVQMITNTSNNANVSITLHNFQVQPYSVGKTSTFASAYNCEGYFTSTTWMGIVTVSILLLILYLSLLCVFSVNTIDKFEDPRGESISVEKLH